MNRVFSLFRCFLVLFSCLSMRGTLTSQDVKNKAIEQNRLTDFPLWIDFQLVLKGSCENSEDVITRPLKCLGGSYVIKYERAIKKGRIERASLFRENESSGQPLSTALFFWKNKLLTDFWVENNEGKIILQDRFIYSEQGQLTKTVTTKDGQNGCVEKVCHYNEKGKLVEESILYKNQKALLYKWIYDDAGKLVEEQKEAVQLSGKEISSSETTSYLQDGVIRRKFSTSISGKLASCSILEWALNAQKKPLFVQFVGVNGEARSTRYSYDEKARLIKKIKPDGVELSYEYDANDKLVHLFSSDQTVDTTLIYGPQGYITGAYDKVCGHIKREFSESGRLVKEDVNGQVLSFTYDAQERRKKMTLPDLSTIRYRYNDNSLATIGRFSSENVLLYEYVMKDNASKSTTDDKENTYLAKLQDTLGGYESFVEYDSFGQVTKEAGEFSNDYTFDAQGKLLEKNGYKADLNAFGELLFDGEALYEYDANGNLTANKKNGESFTYEYDALDRLVRVFKNGKKIEENTYDIFFRRISTKKQQETVQYIFDGDEEIGTFISGQVQELKVVADSTPVVVELQGKAYRTIVDFRSSIHALVDMETDAILETYRYSAFGKEKILNGEGQVVSASHIKNPWRFASRRVSESTHLISFDKRCYLPELLRFVSQDPLSYIDGINTVSFATNDPMRNMDPSGLFSVPVDFQALQKRVHNGITDMYNKSIQMITFARSELEWFFDFRSQFEDVAFKVMNKTVWTLIGYNPDPTSRHLVGRNEANDKVRITLINGILNAHSTATDNAEFISKLHGGTAVHYLYAASSGFTADIMRAIFSKMGFATPQAKLLATTWKDLIKEMGGIKSGGRVIHYAHSLGGTDTYRALSLLDDEERAMIQVATFGSPELIKEGECASVKNYISTHDIIPCLSPVGYIQGRLGTRSDIQFLPSDRGIPGLDHIMTEAPYFGAIEELGRKFQAEYLSKDRLETGSDIIAKGFSSKQKKKASSFSKKNVETLGELSIDLKVRAAIEAKDYRLLGQIIAQNLPKAISMFDLIVIGGQLQCIPLLRAITATKNMLAMKTTLGLNPGELVQISLFIEAELAKFRMQKKYFLSEKETGLPREIEYDPKSKNTFIHLGTRGVKRIGIGFHKIVTKTILYHIVRPEIVANCRTGLADKREMKVIEALQGVRGIVEGRAFITHTKKEHQEDKLEIILKLYNKGSLMKMYYDKTQNFSLLEKLKIAVDLSTGLAGMHKRGLVHRDLHTGNQLINISKTPDGRRLVKAAITDFGRTVVKKECPGKIVQAFRFYVAPEGFFPEKLKSDDYFATDVYALGCVFHEVFYGKDPVWFHDKYFQDADKSARKRWSARQGLVKVLNQMNQVRRQQLRAKSAALSIEERFESIILKMIHPVASQRESALDVATKLKVLYKALKSKTETTKTAK